MEATYTLFMFILTLLTKSISSLSGKVNILIKKRFVNLEILNIGRRRRERHQKSKPGKPWWGGMGQEASTPVSENTPPLTLKSRTVESVAEYVKSGKAKRVVVLVRLTALVWFIAGTY